MTPLSAALAHHRAGRFHEAEKLYRQILQADPCNAEALRLLGLIACEAGRPDCGIDYIRQAIALEPAVAVHHADLGLAYQAAGQIAQAVASLRQAVRLRPDFVEALNNLGALLKDQGQLDETEAHLREALRLRPGLAEARSNLGQILQRRGQLDEAVACYRQALRDRPDLAEAHYNLASPLRQQGRLEEALSSVRECLRLAPRFAAARTLLGQILGALGRPDEPGEGAELPAEATFARAVALTQQGRLEEAVALFRHGLRLASRSALAHNNLGNLLQELVRVGEAIAAYRQALALEPGYSDAHNNLGNALQRAGQIDEAVVSYQKALQAQPNHLSAHCNLGVLYRDQGQFEEAGVHLRAAVAQRPTGVLKVLAATLLPPVYASLEEVHQTRQRLTDNLRELQGEGLRFDLTREGVPTIFYLAYQGCNDRDLQRDLARLYLAGSGSPAPLTPRTSTRSGGRIRVGVISKYLRDHTIGLLLRGLFATLPRDDFELTALPLTAARDPVTEFIRCHADRYVVLPDNVLAARQTVGELGLDVLFYADIGMDPLTYTLAFSRLAPVQCVTWGHPVTSGIPTVDYFLSSELTESAGAEEHYTEQLVRLKSLPFYYYRPSPPSSLKGRGHFGLAEAQHLYGCLQTLFKFHPEFDALLGDILRRDSRGHLVLIQGKYPHWAERLKRRWAMTMPDVLDRVHWLPPLPREDFLSLLAACDVLLDPYPFGGGNSSYEGLALGVPIVTLPAPLLRGRLTYGLYRKMGVLDCVAASGREYAERAVALGSDRSYREVVGGRIRSASHVLFEERTVLGRDCRRPLGRTVCR
jgi:predicted O-linked N-acetylglucosamine transferase (SPINDLY family)